MLRGALGLTWQPRPAAPVAAAAEPSARGRARGFAARLMTLKRRHRTTLTRVQTRQRAAVAAGLHPASRRRGQAARALEAGRREPAETSPQGLGVAEAAAGSLQLMGRRAGRVGPANPAAAESVGLLVERQRLADGLRDPLVGQNQQDPWEAALQHARKGQVARPSCRCCLRHQRGQQHSFESESC